MGMGGSGRRWTDHILPCIRGAQLGLAKSPTFGDVAFRGEVALLGKAAILSKVAQCGEVVV